MNSSALTAKNGSPGQPKLFVLDNIHVAAPCQVKWDLMLGDARVRHCCECNLKVYNISALTRNEAEQLIRSHEGRLCLRFFRRADGTILTRNCPKGLQALSRRVSRIAAAVFTALMSVGAAFSQAAAGSSPQTQAESDQKEAQAGIDLMVVDPTGAVIQNAKVVLCRCKSNEPSSVSTDSNGVARFSGLKAGTYAIVIHASGFKPLRQNVKLKLQKTELLRVKLQIAPTSQTIEVTAAPVEIMGTTVGVLSTSQSSIPPVPISSGPPGPMRN